MLFFIGFGIQMILSMVKRYYWLHVKKTRHHGPPSYPYIKVVGCLSICVLSKNLTNLKCLLSDALYSSREGFFVIDISTLPRKKQG